MNLSDAWKRWELERDLCDARLYWETSPVSRYALVEWRDAIRDLHDMNHVPCTERCEDCLEGLYEDAAELGL